ncbi:MAG: hotdog domain-containing protein [Hyphomicrobiaceae bacterium]
MSGEFSLEGYEATIETRVDSHYANDVVSLGTILEMFGMAGGKLSMMLDGDGGFMRAFESVEFLAPAYQGDYLRVTARLLAVGRTSRRRSYEAYVVARSHGVGTAPSHGEVLKEPILVARAIGTTVTPLELQRITPEAAKRAGSRPTE